MDHASTPLGDYTHKTDHEATPDPYKENYVDAMTVVTLALTEEVSCPGTATIDEDKRTIEPEEKLVNLWSNSVLTGTHTPSRLASKEVSTKTKD